jgi:mRNA interferase MazF
MTGAPMPTFEVWDIVKVPFPYTDRPVRQWRPALAIAAGRLEDNYGLIWALLITSAENRGWSDDIPISNLSAAGLPAPSVVRCAKVATIEAADAQRVGRLPAPDRAKVSERLNSLLSRAGAARK